VLMRSRACLPSSRAHSLRAEASPAMEARSTYRAVLFCKLGLELARLSQLCVDVVTPRR
jgi:hypothetical protein